MPRGRAVKTRERVAYAQRRRAEGARLREIAAELGVSKQTVGAWLTDPDGSRLAARKDSYRGVCEDCGGPTDGSAGPGKAPTRCADCIAWTPEQIIAAVQAFAADHGRAPTCTDTRTDRCLPNSNTAAKRFGSWNDMLIAAGLPITLNRFPETQALIEGMIREGATIAEVSEVTGLSRKTIQMRLRTRGMRVRDLRPDYPNGRLRDDQIQRIRELRAAGWTYAAIASEVGCRLRTAQRHGRGVLPPHTNGVAA